VRAILYSEGVDVAGKQPSPVRNRSFRYLRPGLRRGVVEATFCCRVMELNDAETAETHSQGATRHGFPLDSETGNYIMPRYQVIRLSSKPRSRCPAFSVYFELGWNLVALCQGNLVERNRWPDSRSTTYGHEVSVRGGVIVKQLRTIGGMTRGGGRRRNPRRARRGGYPSRPCGVQPGTRPGIRKLRLYTSLRRAWRRRLFIPNLPRLSPPRSTRGVPAGDS